jgi:hypothetical protein
LGNTSARHNKAVSLFDAGNSLEKFRVQDQDGLGTCYANVLSTVLQSKNKQTEFSYHHIALMHGENGWQSTWKGTQDFVKKDGYFMNEYGNLCSALAAAKKQGGVCPRSSFGFEKDLYNQGGLPLDKNWYQLEVMKNLMTYFDYQKNHQASSDVARINSDIQKFKDFYDKTVDALKLCEQSPEIGQYIDPAESFAKNYVESKLFDLLSLAPENEAIPSSSCFEEGQKYLNGFTEQKLVFEDNYWRFGDGTTSIRQEKKNLILADIKSDPEYLKLQAILKEKIKDPVYLAGKNSQGDNFWNNDPDVIKLIDKVKAEIKKKMIDENPNLPALVQKCPELQLDELEDDINVSTKWEILNDFSYKTKEVCARYSTLDYLSMNDSKSLLQEFNNGEVCQDEGLKVTNQAFHSLLKLGFDTNQIMEKLSPSISLSQSDKLLSVLAPECKDNKMSLENLSCAQFDQCDFGQDSRKQFASNYSGPVGGCNDYGTTRYDLRTHALKTINEGVALNLDICPEIFKTSSSTLSNCPDSGHAVTLTGYRCDKGEIRYEILNSWGQYCPAKAEEGYKNDIFECELDKNSGQPTGRFWIKEKELIKNTRRFGKIMGSM